jgi:hypothetical protein
VLVLIAVVIGRVLSFLVSVFENGRNMNTIGIRFDHTARERPLAGQKAIKPRARHRRELHAAVMCNAIFSTLAEAIAFRAISSSLQRDHAIVVFASNAKIFAILPADGFHKLKAEANGNLLSSWSARVA